MSTFLQWCGLICPLSMLALIAFIAVDLRLRQRKLQRAARAFACTRCGAILGVAAIARADELWAKHVSTLYERHPDVKFRLERDLHAECTQCNTRFRFDDEVANFVERAVVLEFERELDMKPP